MLAYLSIQCKLHNCNLDRDSNCVPNTRPSMSGLLNLNIILWATVGLLAVHCHSINGNDPPKPMHSLKCDFESGTSCEWNAASTYEFKMKNDRSVSPESIFLPYEDHTSRSTHGHYAFSVSERYRLTGRLIANNPYPAGQTLCFRFYYYFYENTPASMTLFVGNLNSTKTLFRVYSDNVIRWRLGQFEVKLNAQYDSFILRSNVLKSLVAIDDIDVEEGPCSSPPTELYCNFELDQPCDLFHPVNKESESWKVYETFKVGFYMTDHTTHSVGGHMYGIDFGHWNQTDLTNQTFLIETDQLKANQSYCLRFSYNLWHEIAGTNLFYGVKTNEDSKIQKLWTLGSNSRMWLTRKQSIRHLKDFRIVMGIEVPDGNKETGNVLIDDVFLSLGDCPSENGCDFENGDICSFETIYPLKTFSPKGSWARRPINSTLSLTYLEGYSDVTWHVFDTQQSNHFVQYDRTTNSKAGKYLLMIGKTPYDRAITVTDRYPWSENKSLCITLAVYKPSNLSSLELFLGESLIKDKALKVWDLQEPTNGWEEFDVMVHAVKKDSLDAFFYIVGTIDQNTTYIGIDDIRINAVCPDRSHYTTLAPTQTTTTSEITKTTTDTMVTTKAPTTLPPLLTFSCIGLDQKKIFLYDEQICDFVQDCRDNEDEKYCGNCDFDEGQMCGWENVDPDNIQMWRTIHPASKSLGYMPKIDGNSNQNGGYISLFSSTNQFSDYAVIKSPKINGKTTQNCRLQFDYINRNGDPFVISLDEEILFKATKQVNTWQSYQIVIGSQNPGFTFYIKAMPNSIIEFYDEDLAVDNIELVDCN